MAYTAIEKMRRRNREVYGFDAGPMQPVLPPLEGSGLRSAALRFLHFGCEELEFDLLTEKAETESGVFRGKSSAPGQIPYNMEMDLRRLCLARELERFFDSGAAQDAFTVSYCFLSIFSGNPGTAGERAEFLRTLGKEWDADAFLVRSVSVFALGLAVYETSSSFRERFCSLSRFGEGEIRKAAHLFLELWGKAALLQDVSQPSHGAFSGTQADDGVRDSDPGRCGSGGPEVLTPLGKETRIRLEKLLRKEYGESACENLDLSEEIGKITGQTQLPFEAEAKPEPDEPEKGRRHVSRSSFLHLLDLAAALNARYAYQGKEAGVSSETIMREFESLSLEYRLSNINQAKSFAEYLKAIGCFYTDLPSEAEKVIRFSRKELERIALMEHERWIREHSLNGWRFGTAYEKIRDPSRSPGDLREQFRMHRLMMDGEPDPSRIRKHYESLPREEQEKDYRPFESMLRLIEKFDGVRIYRMR